MDIFGNFSKLKGDKKKRFVDRMKVAEFSYSDIAVEAVEKVEDKETGGSTLAVKAFLVLLFLSLIFRLFYLQVVQGERYQLKAESNRISPRVIDAPRGVITDKDGVWLARNKPNFGLGVYPSELPKKTAERENEYARLAELTGVPADEVKATAEKNTLFSLNLVLIKDSIAHDDALILEKRVADMQGVEVVEKSSREYAFLPGLAHLIGYTGVIDPEKITDGSDYFVSDRVGTTGLEATYEKYLKGTHGMEQIEVDSKGSIVRILAQDGRLEPVSGYDISLYLDRGLQQKTAEALQNGILQARIATKDDTINAGVAAVMDVRTGGMLSLVSLPDYDNNLFATKISNDDYKKLTDDKSYPMFNRAIQGTYPPGSVSKIILAAAGLAEGTITKNTSFNTPPEIKIGDFVFPDWKDHSYESTNVVRAIAESNNIFFYALGGGFDKIKGIGIDKLNKYWSLFGLGEKTGVDLSGEALGLLPNPGWKKKTLNADWYIGDTYHAAIGQGDLLVTPLQMLRATVAIANGGKLLHPQIVKKVSSHDGKIVEEFGSRIERENFISPDIIRTVQEGMRMAVTEGSARNMSDLPVPVAGKTGTAQFQGNQKTHAWFEAYAPYNDPQIAILVMVEGGGGGHEIAAPVAHDILNYYFTR